MTDPPATEPVETPGPPVIELVEMSVTGAGTDVYFTDRGIEELEQRRGEEEVTLAWLADRLRDFTDVHPEFENATERLATWLARLDDPED